MPEPTHVGRHRTVSEAFKNISRTVTETRLAYTNQRFFGTELPGVFRPFELHVGRDYSELR